MNFTIHPAIRPGTGLSSGWSCPTNSFECPDEGCGCPYTRWGLCGLRATKPTIEQQVRFLTCYDSQNIPYSSDWVSDMNPMDAAQTCVQDLGMDWADVKACGGSISGDFASGNYTEVIGNQSWQLATEAAQYFYDTFPDYRGVQNAMFHVPHLYIDDVDQGLDNLEDMWNITAVLCANGADAAAVCAGVKDALPPIWDGATRHHREMVV